MATLKTFVLASPTTASSALTRGFDDDLATARGGLQDKLAIAPGEPLHITWKSFYTGELRNKLLQKENRPVVLSAFAKTGSTAAAAPRVIAALITRPLDSTLVKPPVQQAGRQTLSYTSAAQESQLFELEVISKAGSDEDLKKVETLLSKASGLPLLAVASGWLTAGAMIAKVASAVAQAVQRDKVVSNVKLDFPCGGAEQPPLQTQILCANDPESLLRTHDIAQASAEAGGSWQLLDKTTRSPYRGGEAYVILQVSQTPQPALVDFEAERYAAELLAGWVPKENVDFRALVEAVKAGVKAKKAVL